MGLKKTNYEVKKLGLVLPEAYAQIVSLTVDLDGTASAIVAIQQDRNCVATCLPLVSETYRVRIDKDKPAHRQVYEKLKENLFKGWDDDIVEDVENGEDS